jgi:hypothetical protein
MNTFRMVEYGATSGLLITSNLYFMYGILETCHMLPFLSFDMDLDHSWRFHRVSSIACHAKMNVRNSNVCTTQWNDPWTTLFESASLILTLGLLDKIKSSLVFTCNSSFLKHNMYSFVYTFKMWGRFFKRVLFYRNSEYLGHRECLLLLSARSHLWYIQRCVFASFSYLN